MTTDMWTSRHIELYMTLTCRPVTYDWNLQACIHCTAYFAGDHTAENISTETKKIADEWEIKLKIACIVVDNAANVVAAWKRSLSN